MLASTYPNPLASYSVEEMDINQIIKHIYLGDKHCARNRHFLKKLGVKAILVAGHELTQHFPEDFQYLQVKVQDSEKQSIDVHFEETCEFIGRNVAQGKTVLVHCAFGISRSTTLVIAYLIKKLRLKYQEAFSFVRRKRPEARPNRGFVEQLRSWEQQQATN